MCVWGGCLLKIKISLARKKIRKITLKATRMCQLATRYAGGVIVERMDKTQCL